MQTVYVSTLVRSGTLLWLEFQLTSAPEFVCADRGDPA